jgi:hypothetical protein
MMWKEGSGEQWKGGDLWRVVMEGGGGRKREEEAYDCIYGDEILCRSFVEFYMCGSLRCLGI